MLVLFWMRNVSFKDKDKYDYRCTVLVNNGYGGNEPLLARLFYILNGNNNCMEALNLCKLSKSIINRLVLHLF